MSLDISQWIDLGVHRESCMVDPQTCGQAGGAISVWLRLHSSDHDGGCLTTRTKVGGTSLTSPVSPGITIGNLGQYTM